jgi:hypothetical protein
MTSGNTPSTIDPVVIKMGEIAAGLSLGLNVLHQRSQILEGFRRGNDELQRQATAPAGQRRLQYCTGRRRGAPHVN